jgi:hypothetical protein
MDSGLQHTGDNMTTLLFPDSEPSALIALTITQEHSPTSQQFTGRWDSPYVSTHV